MTSEELQTLITQILPQGNIHVEGDGYHFTATVIANDFSGLSPVKRQQLIYKELAAFITGGTIHALTLNTYTPEEWKQHHG